MYNEGKTKNAPKRGFLEDGDPVSIHGVLRRLYHIIAVILHMHGKLSTLLQRELRLISFAVHIPLQLAT
ncbi:hypothetical protein Trydic_g17896 [Trypoxylus dichotomus]